MQGLSERTNRHARDCDGEVVHYHCGMRFHRAAKRVSSWIAILAVAMISFAPAVSQALSQAGLGSFEEDCASHALTSAHHEDDTAPQLRIVDHCNYCSMHFTALALPMPPTLAHAAPEPGSDPPPLLLAGPSTMFAWAAAQPRAPPRA
jgi:hypothetical protein